MILARWNYTPDEWRCFRNWKTRKAGLFFYLLHWLRPPKNRRIPEIRIMPDRVWVNNSHEPFQNSQRRFMEIHIVETRRLHILEINYEFEKKIREINVPIPRGKLREALEVQERLLFDGESIG